VFIALNSVARVVCYVCRDIQLPVRGYSVFFFSLLEVTTTFDTTIGKSIGRSRINDRRALPHCKSYICM